MITLYYHELWEALKNTREWVWLSQKELAIEAGISPASISLLESWANKNIWLENLERIISALSNREIKQKEYWTNTWNIVLSFNK